MTNRDVERTRRRALRGAYERLHTEVLAILFDADPANIISEEDVQRDEYSPEVRTILPRLRSARDEEDVAQIMHSEFLHWFGEHSAGSIERYRQAAPAVWAAWQRYEAATEGM